jgi:hypothetical protein
MNFRHLWCEWSKGYADFWYPLQSNNAQRPTPNAQRSTPNVSMEAVRLKC